MTTERDQFGFLMNAVVIGELVHRLTPQVQRDEHGSYLPGDRSPAMAKAIAADIRHRALTEPGYLDHWKSGAGAVPGQSVQKTSHPPQGRAEPVAPAAGPAPRRSARLAQPARAPALTRFVRSQRAARSAFEVVDAGAAPSSRLGCGPCAISVSVAMAALCQCLDFQGKKILETALEEDFQ